MPPNVLGHLHQHIQLQCPEELGVMMCDVLLSGIEELFLGASSELRPALAVGDPQMLFFDRGHMSLISAVRFHLARPAEGVGRCDPGVHAGQDSPCALSIRFQNVAARRTRH